jgi:uncharacterized repeat protein (TIGR03806 family)
VVGPVYRGSAIPDLVGTLLFTDFYDGQIRALVHDSVTGQAGIEVLAQSGSFLSSFGEGTNGEIYALDYYGSRILRLDAGSEQEEDPEGEVPALLSQTGCMDPEDPSQPGTGLIPYGVQHALWSDGAEKERWMAIPDGQTIEIDESGDWDPPIGSVLVKQFSVDEHVVETRLFMRHDDGNWAGYSYAWDEAGDDATLLEGAAQKEFGDSSWRYPSRSECLQCHTTAAGGSLGLETAQLNGLFDYSQGSAHQLSTLEHIGLIELDGVDLDPSLEPRSTEADSARSLLHVNCSSCHRPEGTGGGDLDLRWDRELDEMGGCGMPPEHGDIGVSEGLLIAPGDPARSILSQRMHAIDHARMPPVGTELVDTEGVAAVDAWIGQLQDCSD